MTDPDDIMVITRGKGGCGELQVGKGGRMGVERDLTSGCVRMVRYTDDVLLSCTIDTYVVLLTNVPPIHSIKTKEKKKKRGTPGTPTALHLPQPQSLLVFTARSYGGLLFLALDPWAGEPGLGFRPLAAPGGTSVAKIPLSISSCHTWVRGQPLLPLHPSSRSPCGFLFTSLLIGLLFS